MEQFSKIYLIVQTRRGRRDKKCKMQSAKCKIAAQTRRGRRLRRPEFTQTVGNRRDSQASDIPHYKWHWLSVGDGALIWSLWFILHRFITNKSSIYKVANHRFSRGRENRYEGCQDPSLRSRMTGRKSLAKTTVFACKMRLWDRKVRFLGAPLVARF